MILDFLSLGAHFNTALYIVNIVIALTIIFLERKNPSSTLAWVLVLYFLPVIGLILYLIFSQNISRHKIYKLTDREYDIIKKSIKMQVDSMNEGSFYYESDTVKKWENLVRLNQTYGRSFLTQNNEIEIFTDGRELFNNLIYALKRAEYSINVMYFIIKDDMVSRKFIDTLIAKSKEGVNVRLMVDALGSRKIDRKRLKLLEDAGGKVAYFFPPRLKPLGINFNYRNHRKIVVIDDSIGFTGGFNIGNEYLSFDKKFGYWRDTHLRLKGSAVKDLNAVFLMDWRVATGEYINLDEIYYSPSEGNGNSAVQIVTSGPESEKEEIKRAMMRMIADARNTIYLQTPYFVPDMSMVESLKMAAQSGVEVNIMIPCKPDHIFVYWANYSYCGELLKSGARVFIYENGFLHAKTLMVDGEVATVGSANFDRRSFKLNFEANAVVYDEEFSTAMENRFREDLKWSRELTLKDYEARSALVRIKEAISRLLSDIL